MIAAAKPKSAPNSASKNRARRTLDFTRRSVVVALLTAGWSRKRAAKYVRCSLETLLAEAARNSRFRYDLERAELKSQRRKARRHAKRLQQSATAPPTDTAPTDPVPVDLATEKPVRASAQPVRRQSLADREPQTRRASKRRPREADAGKRAHNKAAKPRKSSKKRSSDEFGPPAPEFDTPEKIAAIHARIEWMLENDPRVQRIIRPPLTGDAAPSTPTQTPLAIIQSPPAAAELRHAQMEPSPPQPKRIELAATCESPLSCKSPSVPAAFMDVHAGPSAHAHDEQFVSATQPASPHARHESTCKRLWLALRRAVLALVALFAWMTGLARAALLARVVRLATPALLGEGRQKPNTKPSLIDAVQRARNTPGHESANGSQPPPLRSRSICAHIKAVHPP